MHEQLCERGLAAARLADQRGRRPLRKREVDPVQDLLVGIGEADVLELDIMVLSCYSPGLSFKVTR